MTFELLNGRLFIDNQEVLTVIYKSGEITKFPIAQTQEKIFVKENASGISITNSKNVITPGSTIFCGGDFKLGDQ